APINRDSVMECGSPLPLSVASQSLACHANPAKVKGWTPENECRASLHLLKEGEQAGQFGLVGPRTVFADLEGFGVLDLIGFILAIPRGELAPEALGNGLTAAIEALADLLLPLGLFGRIVGHQVRISVRTALSKL